MGMDCSLGWHRVGHGRLDLSKFQDRTTPSQIGSHSLSEGGERGRERERERERKERERGGGIKTPFQLIEDHND